MLADTLYGAWPDPNPAARGTTQIFTVGRPCAAALSRHVGGTSHSWCHAERPCRVGGCPNGAHAGELWLGRSLNTAADAQASGLVGAGRCGWRAEWSPQDVRSS